MELEYTKKGFKLKISADFVIAVTEFVVTFSTLIAMLFNQIN